MDTSISALPAEYSAVNILLVQFGFPPVATPSAVLSSLSLVVKECGRRGTTIESKSPAMANEARVNRSFTESLGRQEEKMEELRRKNDLLSGSNGKLTGDLDALKKRSVSEIRKLKTLLDGEKQKVKAIGQQVKAKEVMFDKLKKKFMEGAESTRRQEESNREVFKQLKQRGARKGSAEDGSALGIIGMYESHKERIEEEVDFLRGEVRGLNEALRVKENAALSDAVGGMKENVAMQQRKEAEEVQMKELALLKQQEDSFRRKFSKLESKLSDVKQHLKSAQDENTNMLLELNSRPTTKQQRVSERRIDELERKLYAAVEAANEAGDVRELRKHVGTKNLIEKDKTNHRLRLERLDAIPREISKEILKECCRELEVSDVTMIAPCIRKMCKAMLLLPRLEKFINDVCGFVFKGQQGKKSMEEVMPVLKKWEKMIGGFGKNSEFKSIVIGELCRRSVVPGKESSTSFPGATAEMSDEQAMRGIRDLVELEKMILARDDLYMNAETVVQDNPDLFVNRVVLHFRYLFGVKQMEGVFPKMNEVYLFVNEMNAFVRELRGMFGMRNVATATVVKAMLEVASEMQKGGQLKQYERGEGPGAGEEEEEEHENYVVM